MMTLRKILAELKRHLFCNSASAHVKDMKKLWKGLSQNSRLGFIAHLQSGAEWDEEEFATVGSLVRRADDGSVRRRTKLD
jgi:hypothetical protein